MQLGIPLAFSPWNSHFHLQGEDAYNWRWNYGPDYPLNDTVVASYGGTNDIVQQTSATGSGVYNLVHWEPEHTTYGDPIDDAWGWAVRADVWKGCCNLEVLLPIHVFCS